MIKRCWKGQPNPANVISMSNACCVIYCTKFPVVVSVEEEAVFSSMNKPKFSVGMQIEWSRKVQSHNAPNFCLYTGKLMCCLKTRKPKAMSKLQEY